MPHLTTREYKYNGNTLHGVAPEGEPEKECYLVEDLVDILGSSLDHELMLIPTEVVTIQNSRFTSPGFWRSLDLDPDTDDTRTVTLFGLRALAFICNAKDFARWATNTLLSCDNDSMKSAYAALTATCSRLRKERDTAMKEHDSKTVFADSVANSTRTILLGELCKDLSDNNATSHGEPITLQHLLEDLEHQLGYLRTDPQTGIVTPTEKAVENHLLAINTIVRHNPDGSSTVTYTYKITGKGRIAITSHYLGKE
ncbi:phage antirepressor KilAC domain-containing protein [Bifidobacterium tissieri]|uniref:Antirepressor protein C-terminal domain-containing protein n=1 Tax=Bifidobacterium tissieri TaxID=1630162 RepID=A0A5M9ZM65_9BIFI|nr:phage antirepressor KilAC domain-containing protein [Bifidobacterium tissieri]KAA8828674.1 hypothetical protein EM849_11595 [Bifidobacterium tissieri]KAA8831617.1 hypothetical protein EMO89_02510 [Bifidobacterium tissieri]